MKTVISNEYDYLYRFWERKTCDKFSIESAIYESLCGKFTIEKRIASCKSSYDYFSRIFVEKFNWLCLEITNAKLLIDT